VQEVLPRVADLAMGIGDLGLRLVPHQTHTPERAMQRGSLFGSRVSPASVRRSHDTQRTGRATMGNKPDRRAR
jgi:hypothetical protein